MTTIIYLQTDVYTSEGIETDVFCFDFDSIIGLQLF